MLASTHGHEVGWSMLPVARSALRRIGDGTDVVTFVSRYTAVPVRVGVRARGAALEYLPPGVDTDRFRPDAAARAELRARYGLGERPTVVCLSRLVPRKGQDMLIRAMPSIRQRVDGAALVIVGGGPYPTALRKLATGLRGGRARDVHRRRARRRTARPPRGGRRVRDAVPHPRRGHGRRGPGHRLSGGLRDGRAGGRGPVGRGTGNRAATARPGWWSTADSVAIAAPVAELLADPRPGRRDGRGGPATGWIDNGSGARWPRGWPSLLACRRLAATAQSFS